MADRAKERPEKIRCDACPVLCYIAEGLSGACDRYANHGGELVRLDPLTIIEGAEAKGVRAVPFLTGAEWDGDMLATTRPVITAVQSGRSGSSAIIASTNRSVPF